jgi:hypothetical protein
MLSYTKLARLLAKRRNILGHLYVEQVFQQLQLLDAFQTRNHNEY